LFPSEADDAPVIADIKKPVDKPKEDRDRNSSQSKADSKTSTTIEQRRKVRSMTC
jgi:hypothetical protein